MNKDEIMVFYNEFLKYYNQEEKDALWKSQSSAFKKFWNEKVLSTDSKELNDQEIDDVIRILDRNAKGNTKDTESIARAMIPQGAWRRMFNQIHADKKISSIITKILIEDNIKKKSEYINKLYEINLGNKNNLTGKSGNAINDFLAAFDPFINLSIISLKDRKKLIEYFNISNLASFESESIGEKIVNTNKAILDYFHNIDDKASARTISCFCYSSQMKQAWKDVAEQSTDEPLDLPPPEENIHDNFLFYMESQLEDFLIENWDKTEIGKKYDLIEEDGDLISQQYRTSIGKIDILARDKESGKYVIIELKRNQTSDDTIGQLTRYMGWVEEHKSNGELTKGLIIAGKYDERLYYAIKKVQDVEVYLYKVDFKLEKFKK